MNRPNRRPTARETLASQDRIKPMPMMIIGAIFAAGGVWMVIADPARRRMGVAVAVFGLMLLIVGIAMKRAAGQIGPNASVPPERRPPESPGWTLLMALLAVMFAAVSILILLGARPPGIGAWPHPAVIVVCLIGAGFFGVGAVMLFVRWARMRRTPPSRY